MITNLMNKEYISILEKKFGLVLATFLERFVPTCLTENHQKSSKTIRQINT